MNLGSTYPRSVSGVGNVYDVTKYMNDSKDQPLYIQKSCTKDVFLRNPKPTIAIHGIAGSFTDQAIYRYTHEILGLTEKEYIIDERIEAKEVLRTVSEGDTTLGIFAFANSGSGGYVASIEAMGVYQYELLALFTMPITMCLLSHPSIGSPSELKEFRGHPVAIAQCRHTLHKQWPTIPVHPDGDDMDTALSAKLLASGVIAPTSGIFASERAADLYGLRVLARGIHHDPHNATCFALIRAVPHK